MYLAKILVILLLASSLQLSAQDQKLDSALKAFEDVEGSIEDGYLQIRISSRIKEQMHAYYELQNTLAASTPVEWERPIIELFIQSPWASQQRIGLLGGMGPLSDARIIDALGESIDENTLSSMSIHLLSLPPPRTMWQILRGGWNYGYHLQRFMRHNYQKYFLVSNAAHLNHSLISFFSGAHRVFHLPRYVANHMTHRHGIQDSPSLILSTDALRQAKLYQDLLRAKGMQALQLDDSDQGLVSAWIQTVKQGRLSATGKEEFSNFLSQMAEKYKVKSLLLACTELSIAYHYSVTPNSQQGFTIIDSEKLLLNAIQSALQQ
ncbi:aspartate/glutamate racemase family protein [Pseudobacteriovorax antillogorgiicola]|uniref:Aspartate/glutamate racemase n=1 Tax=Pseudobacteriovorax antillogorgiicola TaxID=1513793 RepID=A0A1Y6C9B1_9BACT|nr:aspartate/glutamate racemase family protein [Pseudobacteriovorax antillogorgiicola]TCS49046.1 aspartate/glutamate racemase [Pseudobacteriovorax antillogorgiicola]SMF52585.1 Aspartate/glutamate racemase [Pseudobacteriovorax antillogorgiicola]